jgi:hypothetical protein
MRERWRIKVSGVSLSVNQYNLPFWQVAGNDNGIATWRGFRKSQVGLAFATAPFLFTLLFMVASTGFVLAHPPADLVSLQRTQSL